MLEKIVAGSLGFFNLLNPISRTNYEAFSQNPPASIYAQAFRENSMDKCDPQKENLDIRYLFNTGESYFKEGEKNPKTYYFEMAVKCLSHILTSTTSQAQKLKREALYYSAISLWRGVENKNPKEALRMFKSITAYGAKDSIYEYSTVAEAQITLTLALENDPFLNLEDAEDKFKKYMKEYPNGFYLKEVEMELREISKLKKKQQKTK